MRYENSITLGQIIQSLSPIASALGVLLFAGVYLVGDVESVKRDTVDNKEAIAKEEKERKEEVIRLEAAFRAEDVRIETAFKSKATEITEQIKESEQRQASILREVQSDVKWLVREKAKNGSKSTSD